MKKLIWTGLAAAACLCAQPGPGFGRGPGRGPGGPGGPGGEMRNPVSGAPFSGTETTVSTQTLANGSTITHSSTTTFYRDSSGRVRTETTIPARPGSTESARTMVTISDPVAGVVHNLDPVNKVSHDMTVRRPNGNAQNRPAPRSATTGTAGTMQDRAFRGRGGANDPNVTHETLTAQTVGGVYATGTRSTHTIKAGAEGNSQDLQSTHEVWESPDLKIPVMVKDTDPVRGTMVRQMTNIVRSEPDAALFQVPVGYTVKTGGPGPGGPGGRRGPGGPIRQ